MRCLRLSLALLLLSATGSAADQDSDISFIVTMTQVINADKMAHNRTSRNTWRGAVSEHGVMAEGQPTIRWNTTNRTTHSGGGWNDDSVRRIQDGFITENTSSGGGFLRMTIRFQGSRCFLASESNFSTITGTCKIISRSPARQGPSKDGPTLTNRVGGAILGTTKRLLIDPAVKPAREMKPVKSTCCGIRG
jgi:hypothetical protein